MGKGDISNLPFDEIAELCQKYSRGREKSGKRDITSRASKSTTSEVSNKRRDRKFTIIFENVSFNHFGNTSRCLKS